MKIAFFETNPAAEAFLRGRLAHHTLHFFSNEFGAVDLGAASDCEAISPFIYSKINAASIARLPALRLVATRSTGFDHVDLTACAQRGITVCNVPSYGENTVAEHTFALILSISRKVHLAYQRVKAGNFSLDGLRGFDIKGKTIGVVGAGHIGLHVIKMAKGLGMRVLVTDIRHDPFLEEVLGFQYVPLDELLARSDIISLHAPYNPQTHHLINSSNLGKIKRGAILINTSRGGLVDTDALCKALEQEILSGAGLDVLEGEEMILEEGQLLVDEEKPERLKLAVQNHRILGNPNVVFTPHNAFNSAEAVERILATTAANIESFAAGAPRNVVPPQPPLRTPA
jgi:D-lactate dehydrogenase